MRFIPRFSITNAIAAALTEIERARGFLDAASLSDEWIDSMRSRAFLLEAHHTTHIEELALRLRRQQTFWRAMTFLGRTRTTPANCSTTVTLSNSGYRTCEGSRSLLLIRK